MTTLTAGTDDELRVACWNVERNGFDDNHSRRRRDVALTVLEQLRPHVLLRQEETHAWDDEYLQREEADRLGLECVLSENNIDSRNPIAVLYSKELFELDHVVTWRSGMHKDMKFPIVRFQGAPQPLALVSVHLCFYSPQLRQNTAKRLTTLGEPGKAALIGGDMNSYPHRPRDERVAETNWADVADAAHFEHRVIERNGAWVEDTEPDRILAAERVATNGEKLRVFTELGHHAAYTLDPPQPDALKPTASLWRTDQGPERRIDRMYATPAIAEAMTSMTVIDSDEVRTASDHAPLYATFSRSALQQALTRAA